ncbi:MAG: hypothetical protein A2845_05280 [Candidatus Lloydbacteria bacterium RIFCSPHIGHO2_01_FULL_49_22]|uniref:methionyl-tRNA formyltransferase n=1 Tax=Candidatus Lloydbacteria bacterium RIFCSPHIGHO2_01_FULL_49_22 TaxID=1798658 RepID=A0A1G2CW08_9BACT|nr:MAG: hypothetical protein A2845_05280 [Candidatus Lloydbacteria bacterium RIFCSPHIGHO2_01_FULL_49_22]OGZ09163.1 MAG: hypothetical protein A3C14_04235 [Candidatus Lloydbacteria bacterium RIFCSPHIGHO2_02_FULL_50_18]
MMKPRFAFFGTPEFAVIILEELAEKGFLPTVIVTSPDAPRGRKLILTSSEAKVWGETREIPVLTPKTLRDEAFKEIMEWYHSDLFIVAAYGKLIPKTILDIPAHGVLNVHPSLLPKFRGPSPIESVILSDETPAHACTHSGGHTGVTIMQLDPEMDHGPIVAQRERIVTDWPPRGSMLTRDLAHFGGALLAKTIPEWMNEPRAHEQDHAQATFTAKIKKEDGLIDLTEDPLKNYKKIRAFDEWPGAFFTTVRNGKNIRVRINDATIENGVLTITRVTPEGKKEMSYEDFRRGDQQKISRIH